MERVASDTVVRQDRQCDLWVWKGLRKIVTQVRGESAKPTRVSKVAQFSTGLAFTRLSPDQ
jgi:hypothetical protein